MLSTHPKHNVLVDTTLDSCQLSLDNTFKEQKHRRLCNHCEIKCPPKMYEKFFGVTIAFIYVHENFTSKYYIIVQEIHLVFSHFGRFNKPSIIFDIIHLRCLFEWIIMFGNVGQWWASLLYTNTPNSSSRVTCAIMYVLSYG